MLAIVVFASPHAFPLTPHSETLSAEQEARYRGLIHELRCLVCQNQTIADSNADLASDLRRQVHERIAAGESDAQIREYVTARYGDFVLYKPPLTMRTLVLWIGPFLILAGALAFVLRLLLKRKNVTAAPAGQGANPQRVQQLLDEEH
ncbi:MAG: cytochrome c-type biogenesis protein [Panacagrimonas sp.]